MIDIGGIMISDIVTVSVTIFALLKIYDEVYKRIFKPKKDSDQRITELERQQKDADKEISEIHKYMFVSLVAIRALLKHDIDGNDVQALKDAGREIDRYLNEKVKE